MDRFAIARKILTARVKKVSKENYRVTTLEIGYDMKDAKPGQFMMVWVPGVGERPMSIGNGSPLTISVADVGAVSGAISKLKAGDLISFRGPYGRPFTIPKAAKRILVIGGGYGVVPMHFLAKAAREKRIEPLAIIGARSADDIIYDKRLAAICADVRITTDDGSRGKKGNVMVELELLLGTGNPKPETGNRKPDAVYACGPERMMEAVARLCVQRKVPCEVSIERHMKCGVGVCGSCAINGRLCCMDGPVFSAKEALAMSEFGKARRGPDGAAKGL
jgi:dihydroorotate dehydrogenase electron transfer subunit